MTRRLLALLLGLALASASGCAGTETGNPSFEGELAYDAYSSDVTRVALRAGGAGPEPGITLVDSAWLVLGDVTFTGGAACGEAGEQSVHATGIGEGDHAAQGRVVTALALDEGNYCGVRVPLERAPAQAIAGPPELGAHSILIHGAAPDGHTYRLRSSMQAVLELSATAPFELSTSAGTVLIGFDLAAWLGAIDWSRASVVDDTIEIDDAHNVELLTAFEAAIARGTGLYRADATAPIDAANPLAVGQ